METITLDSIIGKRFVSTSSTNETNTITLADIIKILGVGSNVRVLKADDMWTSDYVPTRLNVHLNKRGLIEKTRMG